MRQFIDISLTKREIAFLAIGGAIGSFFAAVLARQFYTDPTRAAKNVLDHQIAWRSQWHSTGEDSPQINVSLFRQRPTGAINWVVHHNLVTGQYSVLITLQDRGKERGVLAEPPAGFFNGEYPDGEPLAHSIVDEAETALARNPGQKRGVVYQEIMRQKRLAGTAPERYVPNTSLRDVADKETLEETGIDLDKLEKQQGVTLIRRRLLEVDCPSCYFQTYLTVIQSSERPTSNLAVINSKEVEKVQWIGLDAVVERDGGYFVAVNDKQYPIKRLPFVLEAWKMIYPHMQADDLSSWATEKPQDPIQVANQY